jgi:hypothetical protein
MSSLTKFLAGDDIFKRDDMEKCSVEVPFDTWHVHPYSGVKKKGAWFSPEASQFGAGVEEDFDTTSRPFKIRYLFPEQS